MADELAVALKEWAAICRALMLGRQSLIVRKGGIAEVGDSFRLEATRFLLYPTFVHQQETGLQPAASEILEDVKRDQPEPGRVRLEAWAEVTGVYQIREALPAQLLAHLHLWSDEAIDKRFHYRQPGLNVVALRVHRLPTAIEIDEDETYRGCKSWVPLKEAVSTLHSTPVLSDAHYREVIAQLDTLLRPIGRA
jgi:hypothetical protein